MRNLLQMIIQKFAKMVPNYSELPVLVAKQKNIGVNEQKSNVEIDFIRAYFRVAAEIIIGPETFAQLKILDVNVTQTADAMKLTIVLARPGLLIGKKGFTLRCIIGLLQNQYKKKVSFHFIEKDLWTSYEYVHPDFYSKHSI